MRLLPDRSRLAGHATKAEGSQVVCSSVPQIQRIVRIVCTEQRRNGTLPSRFVSSSVWDGMMALPWLIHSILPAFRVVETMV